MSDHGLAWELPATDRARPREGRGSAERAPSSPLPLSDALALCDRHLNEVGRRNHLFGWLRSPDGGPDAWLPVDAYYPRHRLVVLYRPRARPDDQVYRELVPQHRLRLLVLSPDELGSTAAGAERALAALLRRLEPTPAAATASPATNRAATAKPTPTPTPTPTARASARPSAPSSRRDGTPDAGSRPSAPLPSAAARAERFLATQATRDGRRAPVRTSNESPLVAVAFGAGLVLVLLVAVIYIVSSVG